MSREREIEQGLRERSGCLTFTLVAEEYSQGHIDYEAGASPPDFSSPSYDLGRFRAAEKADNAREVMDKIRRDREDGEARMRAILRDRPDVLAEYDARISAIREG